MQMPGRYPLHPTGTALMERSIVQHLVKAMNMIMDLESLIEIGKFLSVDPPTEIS